MPGGVIKIKFHSSKHSGTQSITHHVHYVTMESSLRGYLRNIQIGGRPYLPKSTPGGERNLNILRTQAS